MTNFRFIRQNFAATQDWMPKIVAVLVAITGLFTIDSTLQALVHLHRSQIVNADAHSTLLAGLSLIYLATLLYRSKRNALLVSIPIFLFLFIRNVRHFDYDLSGSEMYGISYFLNNFLPLLILAMLVLGRNHFKVRSEILNFTTAVRRSLLIILVAFVYGTAGFYLLDARDFHQEFSLFTAAHYTVDQFNITTTKPLVPHTKRAQLFLDSLTAISFGSLFYVGLSLFAPIRFRLSPHTHDFEEIRALLQKYPSNSEDFFKLWPRDKAYFFGSLRQSALAYKVGGSTALVVGDPAGNKKFFNDLLTSFNEFCFLNDWQPAFIHTLPDNLNLYKNLGYEAQKIGEEAILDIDKFVAKTVTNKYFRHINNKFVKQSYTCEIFEPPHNESLMHRIKEISDDWLSSPGRSERGFMMGYFNEAYMQQCRIMVVRDAAGTIRAFVNQIPTFDKHEANFDFLRHSRGSQSNINDFLMINFIGQLKKDGFTKLNMGLSPLSGLDEESTVDRTVMDSFLNLVYANSSRFYSFQGLRRFKAKFEPDWRTRYIVYQGGVVGLTRTANALVRAMRVKN